MGWQERDYAREAGGGTGSDYGSWRGAAPGGRIVRNLIIANVVVYVLCYVIITPLTPILCGSAPTGRAVMTDQGPRLVVDHHPGYCDMVTTKVLHGQVWRLFTSQYLHANQTHIIFNMIGLYFLGQALERKWSTRKFFAVYTLSGICGNLLFMAAGTLGWISMQVPAARAVLGEAAANHLYQLMFSPAVGASGCILGLLGAAAVLFPHAEVYVYMLFPIKIRTAAILFAVGYAFNIYRQGDNYGGDLCHMAGLAFGAWWAWRGDRWWETRRLGTVTQTIPPPRAEVWSGVGQGPWRQKVESRVADEETVDRILTKVREGGIATLSEQEKRTLLDATARLREADARAGRVDRL
jgi:membrane associated rhomboid family serine protease